MSNVITTDIERYKRMKELGMPDWKIAKILGFEGDEVFGESDPFSGVHSNGDSEVEYSEEEDLAINL